MLKRFFDNSLRFQHMLLASSASSRCWRHMMAARRACGGLIGCLLPLGPDTHRVMCQKHLTRHESPLFTSLHLCSFFNVIRNPCHSCISYCLANIHMACSYTFGLGPFIKYIDCLVKVSTKPSVHIGLVRRAPNIQFIMLLCILLSDA